MIGRIFHRLKIIAEESQDKNGNRIFLCQCNCGKTTKVSYPNLSRGNTKSCGCLKHEGRIIHGHDRQGRQTSEYMAWASMLARCTNPTNKDYKNYGGREIKVFEEWKNDFILFLEYLGPKPTKMHSIERMNNNGDYIPGNVRWATRREQCNNRRTNHKIEYSGDIRTLAEWSRKLSISYDVLKRRIQMGWSIEKTFNTPIKMSTNKSRGSK